VLLRGGLKISRQDALQSTNAKVRVSLYLGFLLLLVMTWAAAADLLRHDQGFKIG
jgi:hypothetical protein